MHPDDIEKTAFSPGPGMGLYQFNRMPFGLTGAPGYFQLLMRGLSFVSTFIDDILIHSPDAETHVGKSSSGLQMLTSTYEDVNVALDYLRFRTLEMSLQERG